MNYSYLNPLIKKQKWVCLTSLKLGIDRPPSLFYKVEESNPIATPKQKRWRQKENIPQSSSVNLQTLKTLQFTSLFIHNSISNLSISIFSSFRR